MSRGANNLQRNLSNGTSEKDAASPAPHPSALVNGYNPIAMINKEINTDECRQLLRKVDRMREILQMERISLPQIVVVGDQSVSQLAGTFSNRRDNLSPTR